MKMIFFFLGIVLLMAGCNSANQKSKLLFEEIKDSGIKFTNAVENTKDFNIFSYRNFYNGGGVAIGDINNDGLADVFFTSNMGSNKLFLNKGNWKFEDISARAGIEEKGRWNTGVVMADINNDGWLDIYVCNAGISKWKEKKGNALFINNGNLTFSEKAAEYGLDELGYTTHAAFFDYDLDGDLDCYILNNSFIPVSTLNYANKRSLRASDWPVEDFLKGGGDKLLRNDNGKFTDVSEQTGIYGSLIGFGLGVTVGDVNGDHYPDIYVSNDFFERDYLYINQKNGTFSEELEQWIQHISHSSMGADMSDINNDGYPDIFVTEMLPDDELRLKTTTSFESIDVQRLKQRSGFYNQFMQNTLQVNNGNGKFLETAFYSGVAASDWSWGALMFDADNDGWNDIYVCNGIYHDVIDQDFIDFFADEVTQRAALHGEKKEIEAIIGRMPSVPIKNKAFRNLSNLKFSDEGEKWGFTTPSFSNGAAYGDLDNDGDLDLVVNNVNQQAFVYKNNSRELNKVNNYIGVLLKGKSGNLFAIGSTVKWYVNNQVITRELIPARGFQSSIDYKIIAGLGKITKVDSMVIIWPDRSVSHIANPGINQVHVIEQTRVPARSLANEYRNSQPLLISTITDFEKHTEDDFIDFNNERNLPAMLSREGPKAAVGDVNGDGRDDIYIGGASGQSGQLYLQSGGGFVKKTNKVFDDFAAAEDVAVLFFDCDNDKDLDLFAGAGGNNSSPRGKLMQDRLYVNDGKGNFSFTDALPPNGMNTAVAIAGDFDNDGDLDLFAGSRSVPYGYGITPESYIYINDGHGKFTSAAKALAPEIAEIGMVTDAAYADLTGDGKNELIIVGEWMAPRVFSFENGKFKEQITDLGALYGWWRSVAVSDLDGDGDKDLVLGNIGKNFYLQPDKDKPVKLWLYDFDENGVTDKILTRSIGGKDMPVFMKRDITDQLPSLKKQNLKHKDYAGKTIGDLIKPAMLSKATVKEFNYNSSCIALNEGNGKFRIAKLPYEGQLSCINAILCKDVNNDGATDLVTGGNLFALLPQFCRIDANYGTVWLNDGKGNFSAMKTDAAGLELRGVIRDIKEIKVHYKDHLLFLQNNEKPVLYRFRDKSGRLNGAAR